MKTTVIFGGTTEGRVLSSMLSREGIKHIVCVATAYGKDMLEKGPFSEIRVGRMNKEEMVSFLAGIGPDKDIIVVDATHPYAEEATANIKASAKTCGIQYVRVKRDSENAGGEAVFSYDDISQCAKEIDATEGNILLTTGSKELGEYFNNVSDDTAARTYVRVLPSSESIVKCEEAGVERDHIIAMQGPFGRDLNEALIGQYAIRHLITKDSGSAGGFEEKVDAALAAGAKVHVIARPYTEDGVDIRTAFSIIIGKETPDTKDCLRITLIGYGPGDVSHMTDEARHALEECDAVFGAKRLLTGIKCPRIYEMYLASDIIPVLEKEDIKNAAIVFSGDTGYCSGAKSMQRALMKWRSDIDLRVIPGISSFSYLASKLQESYDDACLFSLHGRNTDRELKRLAEKVRYNGKVFALMSGAEDVRAIAGVLAVERIQGHITAGCDLSYENEKLIDMTFEEAEHFDHPGIVTVLIVNDSPQRRPLTGVLRDDDLIRDKVPMTKECIRHESIIRLKLSEGDMIFDIGGGTGSVACEAASLSPDIDVYTIERESAACELIRKNVQNLGLCNVTVVEGDAVSVLDDLPKPDRVFVGGSGGKLSGIIELLHQKGSGIRFVINAVTLETVEEIRKVISEYSPEDEESVMISVSDVQKAGGYNMLRAQNPVWIFSFTI